MKIAVYTAIYGDKDELIDPPPEKNCTYICFSDKPINSKIWTVVESEALSNSPRLSAKIFKILPHRYLKDFDFSLWVDGNVSPKQDTKITDLIKTYLRRSDIALFMHPNATYNKEHPYHRNCIYDEAEICMQFELDPIAKLTTQAIEYQNNGYPENNGLYMGSILLRRHKISAPAMERWWAEICRHSSRDQISLPIALTNSAYAATIFDFNPTTCFNFFDHKKQLAHNNETNYAIWLEQIRYILKRSDKRLLEHYRILTAAKLNIPFRAWHEAKIHPLKAASLIAMQSRQMFNTQST